MVVDDKNEFAAENYIKSINQIEGYSYKKLPSSSCGCIWDY